MTLQSMIERAGAAAVAERAPAAPGVPGAAAVAAASASASGEQCGLCGAPVAGEHRHLFDVDAGGLVCACRACALLFDHQGAGNLGRHWRLVPDRCTMLSELKLDDLGWRSLGLPVELAFFARRGGRGQVSAFYPSPAGATQCSLELESWEQIESENPELAEMQADVEALLIDRTGPVQRAFLVGIDDCFRLVAVIRTHWRGFGGGDLVWREIESFFDRLAARAAARA